MAHGYLLSFDHHLIVRSAGTKPAGKVSLKAVKVMMETGIDISNHTSNHVNQYINEEWDFVITVCDNANKHCPEFKGLVKNRLHFGFDDPYDAVGTDDFVLNEYRRVRDEIEKVFREFYIKELKNKYV